MQSSIKRGLVAGLFLFAVSAQAAPQRVLPDACDESYLLAIAGDYLDSLTANDPSGAPMASTLRATENGVVTPPGEGVWKTANAWNYRHTFVDPTTGGIGVFGIPNFGRFYRHVLIEKQFPHHCAVAFKPSGRILYDAAKLLGVPDIQAPRPAGLPYPSENPFEI